MTFTPGGQEIICVLVLSSVMILNKIGQGLVISQFQKHY